MLLCKTIANHTKGGRGSATVNRERHPAAARRARMLEVLRQFRILLRSIQNHYASLESRSGLGGALVWALAEVAAHRRATVGELAHALAVHLSTASNAVRRLESLGLVTREREAGDQRVVHVAITAEGRRLLRRVPTPAAGILQQALLELPAVRLRALQRELDGLLRAVAVEDHEAGAVPLAELLAPPAPGSARRKRARAS